MLSASAVDIFRLRVNCDAHNSKRRRTMTRYYEQKARKNALPPASEQQVAALRAATGAARRMPDPEVGVDFWIETTDPQVIREHRVFDMKENFLGIMCERRNDDYPYCVVFPNGRQLSA